MLALKCSERPTLFFISKNEASINDEAVFVILRDRLLLWFRWILQITLLIKDTVGGAEYDEFRATVELVADFLMLLRLFKDEICGQLVAFFQPWIFLSHFLSDGLRLFLTISHWSQTVFGYAMLYQIVDHRLCSSL